MGKVANIFILSIFTLILLLSWNYLVNYFNMSSFSLNTIQLMLFGIVIGANLIISGILFFIQRSEARREKLLLKKNGLQILRVINPLVKLKKADFEKLNEYVRYRYSNISPQIMLSPNFSEVLVSSGLKCLVTDLILRRSIKSVLGKISMKYDKLGQVFLDKNLKFIYLPPHIFVSKRYKWIILGFS